MRSASAFGGFLRRRRSANPGWMGSETQHLRNSHVRIGIKGAIGRAVCHECVTESLQMDAGLLRKGQQSLHIIPIHYSFLDGRPRLLFGKHWAQVGKEIAADRVLTDFRTPRV